jgi:membrane associated rhomboid family serine protease
MGIYDREYYRGETQGSGWLTGTAPVCRAIILANVAVYLFEKLGFVDHQFVRDWLAATSDRIFKQGHVWELVTATFVHADLFHLIWNMLFLWFVGREIEAMYGTRDFIALYLCAAVISTLGWALTDVYMNDRSLMVGASGAVLAVVVLYALFYPHREVMFMFVIPVQMWLLVTLFVGYQLFLFLRGGDSHTALASHLAGAGFGYVYKRFDLRWSRLPLVRPRRPRFRVIGVEGREKPSSRPSGSAGPTWSSNTASASKPSTAATAVLPEEQLDARLDEVLAKIAREGRSGLTEDDNRVLQEASRRARNRRSDRI